MRGTCYGGLMHSHFDQISSTLLPTLRRTLARMYSWQRVRNTVIACLCVSTLMLEGWEASWQILFGRWFFIGFAVLTTFGVLERVPKRLPFGIARWVWQIVGIVLMVPIATTVIYTLTTWNLSPPWWRDSDRLIGWFTFSILGSFVAQWMTLVALLGQIRGEAERQALGFALERSQLEHQASEARLQLLQRQIEPHFLFNTLASIRELIAAGEPAALQLLDELNAYLRGSMPKLDQHLASLSDEIKLCAAYLAIMKMRMPDRLRVEFAVPAQLGNASCPPLALLTLVENAIKHGIDPSEHGGVIRIDALAVAGQLRISVHNDASNSAPLPQEVFAIGTGLNNLRERTRLLFGANGSLVLRKVDHCTIAELSWPLTFLPEPLPSQKQLGS